MRKPSTWTTRSLIDLATYTNGMAFKPRDWSEEGTPIIRIEQLNDPEGEYDYFRGTFPDKVAISNGDLIFSWSATLKVVIWKHGAAVLNQHLFKVVPKPDVDKLYLLHLLDFHMDDLAGGSQGSTMRHIKRGELRTFEVDVPSLKSEQSRIGLILTTVDNQIEKTEALIAKYQSIKQGLMHDLFTRGVDEHGRLRPTRDEAPQLYKESELGWIPKEWSVRPVGKCYDIKLGKMLHQAAQTGKYARPFVGNRHVQWDRVVLDDLEYMDFSPDEQARFRLQRGDLLMCEGGEVGRTAIWHGELAECYYQKAIHRLRRLDDSSEPLFFLYFMHFAVRNSWLQNFTSQTSIAHLTREKLAVMPSLSPLSREQQRIAERMAAQDAKIGGESKHLGKLRSIKLGLMQDLLTGKVPVKPEHSDQDNGVTSNGAAKAGVKSRAEGVYA
jgi:type I restriction enzyme S subunit